MLTIVMYHYVRDLKRSAFPKLKGLDLSDFSDQLDYLGSHYHPVTVEEVIAATRENGELPENALLLTFDDGYSDHYSVVLAELVKRGWSAAFFPIAATVTEKRLLDVNKIHFILAGAADIREIIAGLHGSLDGLRRVGRDLPPNEVLYMTFAQPGRLDPAEVNYVKRMLQRELPEDIRSLVTAELFRRFVSNDEVAFSEELYMSEIELKALVAAGMHVGSHGHEHIWLNTVSPEKQASDIDRSLGFLDAVNGGRKDWTFCYPYGGLNDSLIGILRDRHCALGFTTDMRIADPKRDNPLLLPRIDTNYLPKRNGQTSNFPPPPAGGLT